MRQRNTPARTPITTHHADYESVALEAKKCCRTRVFVASFWEVDRHRTNYMFRTSLDCSRIEWQLQFGIRTSTPKRNAPVPAREATNLDSGSVTNLPPLDWRPSFETSVFPAFRRPELLLAKRTPNVEPAFPLLSQWVKSRHQRSTHIS